MSALSAAARQEYYGEPGNSLPPPLADQPEYRQRRLTAAVEAFEALCPGDSHQARLAVQIVLSGAHIAENRAKPAFSARTPRNAPAAAPRPPA